MFYFKIEFTASALVSVWPTNSSSLMIIGLGTDRKFSYQTAVAIVTATTAPTTLTSRSISAGVPLNSKLADIFVGSTYASGSIGVMWTVSADATGIGMVTMSSLEFSSALALGAGIPAQTSAVTMKGVQLVTAQTVYWMCVNGATTSSSMYILGYGF
jgi:hypothetical protein